MMPPPHFIIIGAQKSASSFLQVCLTEHPQIWTPVGETPHFESPDYDQASPGALAKLFAGRGEPVLGIKRPNYIGRPEVPPRIAQDCSDARLIAVLRNPIDRAMSAYFHQIKSGFLPPVDAETGLRRLLDDPDYVRQHPRASEILSFGLYHQHLTGYAHFAAHDRLRIFLHEDILKAPRRCIREVYEYLGVDPAFVPEHGLASRPQAVVYNLSRLRLLAWRPRLLYRFDPQHTRMIGHRRNPFTKALAAAIVASDRLVLSRLLGNQKPVLSDGIRQRLKDHYRPDIERLETMLGRDLTAWK